MRWTLYNLLFALGFPLLLPRFLFRMWRRGGYRRHFGNRFGCYNRTLRKTLRDMSGPIWIHGVSVGEVGVARQLADAVRTVAPDSRFVFSTNTSTGYRQALQVATDRDVVVYVPVDYPWAVRRALRRIRPSALILTESELWPNLIRATARQGRPLLLVNARISDRSFPSYRRLRFWYKPLLGLFDCIQAQSELDRDRLLAMGAPAKRLTVTGSFKYDGARRDARAETLARTCLRALWPAEAAPICLMGGSTWPGEEERLLSIFCSERQREPRLRLILAPRHAERADRIAARLTAAGFRVARLSRLPEPEAATDDGAQPILLIDTTGDLMRFYACADIVFVGKSLEASGGQNMLEPVACGKPTLVGPFTQNFRSIMDDLLQARAIIQVPNGDALAKACHHLIANPDACAELARRAEGLIEQRQGVTQASARQVLTVIRHKQPTGPAA